MREGGGRREGGSEGKRRRGTEKKKRESPEKDYVTVVPIHAAIHTGSVSPLSDDLTVQSQDRSTHKEVKGEIQVHR